MAFPMMNVNPRVCWGGHHPNEFCERCDLNERQERKERQRREERRLRKEEERRVMEEEKQQKRKEREEEVRRRPGTDEHWVVRGVYERLTEESGQRRGDADAADGARGKGKKAKLAKLRCVVQ